ncbi:MAG: T9SS type A sorting domain-containing protein [Bacteroidota bacterium]
MCLLISSTYLLNDSNAQTSFPDEKVNQKWEYVTWFFWGGHCESRIVKTGKLTNKCNQVYIQVFDCNQNENDCYLLGYYRIQNDSVLVRTNYNYFNGSRDTVVCDEPEGLMYDFSINESDSVICQINSTWPATFTNFWKVNEADVANEGVIRRVLNMDFQPHQNFPNFLRSMDWIEGIGSTTHPFYSFTCIGDHCEIEQQMVRAFIDDTLIYQDTMLQFPFRCNGWVTSTETLNKDEYSLKIFPNPTADNISIVSNVILNAPLDVRIIDLNGRVLREFTQVSVNDALDISSLSAGGYVVQIFYQKFIMALPLFKTN